MATANDSVFDQGDRALRADDPCAVNVKEGSVFPRQCPNCGQAANVPLTAEKYFIHNERELCEGRVLVRYEVLYCQACATAHEREKAPRPHQLLRRLIRHGGDGLYPLLIGLAIVVAELFDPWGIVNSFPLWQRIVVPAAALLVAGSVFGFGLWETRYMRWTPPTSITSAVDFSDDLSSGFEPRWRQFRFRRADYARAFRDINRDRLWLEGGVEAQRAERLTHGLRRVERYILLAGAAALVVWIILREQ